MDRHTHTEGKWEMAYYVAINQNGHKFLNLTERNGDIYLTTCPHGATLFTSSVQANRLADQLRRELDSKVAVMPTRLWEPNIVRGLKS